MILFENKKITLEHFPDSDHYRITFFNEDLHWAGDITFSESDGVIYDDVKE